MGVVFISSLRTLSEGSVSPFPYRGGRPAPPGPPWTWGLTAPGLLAEAKASAINLRDPPLKFLPEALAFARSPGTGRPERPAGPYCRARARSLDRTSRQRPTCPSLWTTT